MNKPIVFFSVPESKGSRKNAKRKTIPIEGRIRIYREAEFCGNGKQYMSESMVSPTWGTLFKIFKKSMEEVGDYHHAFLEGIRVVTLVDQFNEYEKETGIKTCAFITGS